MEEEQLLARVQEMNRQFSTSLAAQDLMLRALIATHPDQNQLKDVFLALVTIYESNIRDIGFEQGDSPEHPQTYLSLLKQRVFALLQHFQ